MIKLCLLYFILSVLSNISANENSVYSDSSYGNDSQFNPISYYFNASFDTIQNPYYFNQKNFLANHEIVFKRVRNPNKSIEQDGGWKTFFRNEFFSSRAIPNYTLHLIGGGHDYKKLVEWYKLNNYPYPFYLAFITSYAAEFGNEALEASNQEHINSHDHIADLLFFDLLGKFIFYNEDVYNFFVHKLEMKTWAFQPTYDLDKKQIFNAGNNYIFRPNFFNSKIRPFLLFGMQVLTGVSSTFENFNKTLSIGLGPAYTDPLANKSRLATGLFLDDGGNLLFSLLINSTGDYKYRLNLYPSIIKINSLPGLFMAYNRKYEFLLGIQYALPLGLSTAL